MTRLTEIETRIHEIKQERQALSDEEIALRREHDAIRLAQRPVFPNARQRKGIRVAAQRIRAREKPATHHGDSTVVDRSVVVDGRRGWLSVQHGAPYSQARLGSKLWRFTDEEVAELVAYVREQGFTVGTWWTHDGGVSITVVMPE